MESVFEEIKAERAAQDEKWGGARHDQDHRPEDWIVFIVKHLDRADWRERAPFRAAMVKVAALAVAAIEYCDRDRNR